MSSAVAIELLHNAILIHDDVEDASEQRRGRPTLHPLHGVPLAMNAGDMLTLLSWQPLKSNMDRLPQPSRSTSSRRPNARRGSVPKGRRWNSAGAGRTGST